MAVVVQEGQPELVSPFLERVREPSGRFISPESLIGEIGVSLNELARYSRVNRNTITRNPD